MFPIFDKMPLRQGSQPMKKPFFILIYLCFCIATMNAQQKIKADLILINGTIYTVDPSFSTLEAFAVKDGKFLSTGTTREILERYESSTVLDAHGAPVYPGFIDAHSHFYGYALSLLWVDLRGTGSMHEILSILKAKAATHPSEWLTGRGWDQNLWTSKTFPDRQALDSLFPDRPVVLIRIDGHTLLANGEALKRAHIRDASGFQPGEVEVINGRLTGILSENAGDTMKKAIPPESISVLASLMKQAENNCFRAGLTGVADAGEELWVIRMYDSLQKQGALRMKIYAMLTPSDENLNYFVRNGVYHTNALNVRSIKLYADGSLGSRTALLKAPYSDAPQTSGVAVSNPEKIRNLCALASRHGYQVNIHAIGDSAVKIALGIYSEFLKGKNDLRWRIEHAQVVDPVDLPMFGRYSVIPSIQSTHATSDMYWAGDRLGPERVHWAYAYKSLLAQNGWIANGTDFPIEDISPIMTFYAAVARKDLKGFPPGGFQPENAISRTDALRSITVWAAKADFDDNTRGSIEPGKSADFVILDKDLLKIPEEQIPSARVLETYLNGVKVY